MTEQEMIDEALQALAYVKAKLAVENMYSINIQKSSYAVELINRNEETVKYMEKLKKELDND